MKRIEQEDNGVKGQFVVYQGDEHAGEMSYTWAGEDKIIIDHTGVKEKFNGKGLGKDLFEAVIQFVKAKNLKVIPLCPFAKKLFDRDETLNDLKV